MKNPPGSVPFLGPSQVFAAFSLVYGAVRDFHPEFDELLGTSFESAWTNRVAKALREVLAESADKAVPASVVHGALAGLVAHVGDPATRMMPLPGQEGQGSGAQAPPEASTRPVVTAQTEPGGILRLRLNLAKASASEVEQELRKVMKESAAAEMMLDLGTGDTWWEQLDRLPDWRTPRSWQTVQEQSRLAAIGEVLLKLFGTGEGGRVTTAARQHLGLEQRGLDPVLNPDVRHFLGRYQSGLFVRSRKRLPADALFQGALTVVVPDGLAPWLEPALLELKARPLTSITTGNGGSWAAHGHMVQLPGGLWLEVRRWSLVVAGQGDGAATLCSALYGSDVSVRAMRQDRSFAQIADLLALHHTMRTYNPYFLPDQHDTMWADTLADVVQKVLAAGDGGLDDHSFSMLLWECTGTIRGGHTHLLSPDHSRPIPFLDGAYVPAALLEFTAEGRIVVGAVLQQLPLMPGDRLLTVDGQSVEERLQKYLHYLRVYTPAAARFYAARWLLAGQSDLPAVVTVERVTDPGSEALTFDLRRTQFIWDLTASSFGDRNTVRAVEQDGVSVGYIDLRRVGAGELEKALDELSHAAGLVLDMRGYPSAGAPDLSRFFPSGRSYAVTARRPVLVSPIGWQGKRSGWLEDAFELVDPDKTGQESRPLAVLCFGGTASDAEGVVAQLQATGRATLVGTQTKGASGAPVWRNLPGGALLQFSGSATAHNGNPSFEGHGLQPDVECWPTQAGLAAGRDEALELALRIVAERVEFG